MVVDSQYYIQEYNVEKGWITLRENYTYAEDAYEAACNYVNKNKCKCRIIDTKNEVWAEMVYDEW